MTESVEFVGKSKSLRMRLLWGFVFCVAIIWISIVSWGIYSVLKSGHQEERAELNQYARQVVSVVREFRDHPQRLAKAMNQVASIEEEPDDDGETSEFHIQIWIDGVNSEHNDNLPMERPQQDGFVEFEHGGRDWLSYVIVEPQDNVVLRLLAEDSISARLSSGDVVFYFLPLVFSLPLLLLPAWFMTHRGLKPLREIVAQIDERVESGQLRALSGTPYRELNSIVSSTNSLMQRLDRQLERERSFVTDVAHELKTPLAIMQSNIGMLTSSDSEQRREQALKDLSSGVKRGNHLIRQLLRMSRMEQRSESVDLALRSLDVAEFIRERIAHASVLAAEKSIKLELQAPQHHTTETDADAIAAIVDNLLDNAIKYSPLDSNIELSLTVDEYQKSFEISVLDQGRGISPEHREQALKRFCRLLPADRSINGAGLGLSIVSQAVERLGGEISLDANPHGPGLLVHVRIPERAE